jgi:hypothetical protein
MQSASNATAWLNFAQLPREHGGLGLQPHQAAGLVGNLVKESGPDLTPWGPSGDNGTAWGTAQWRGDRLNGLRDFAQSNGLDHRSMQAQQQFMRHEFDTTEGKAYKQLLSASTPEEAASVVNRAYERSADNTGGREQAARQLFSQFGQDGVSAIDSAMGATKPSDGATMAYAPTGSKMPDTTPPPDNGLMGQLGGLLGRMNYQNPQTGYSLSDALGGVATGLMSIDNAKGAAVLAAQQAAQQKTRKPDGEFAYDPKSGTFYRTKADGRLEMTKNPNFSDEEKKAKLTESALKHVGETMEKYDYLSQSSSNAADILDDLNSGKLDLGMFKNWINSGKNLAGVSDDQSRAYSRYNQYLQGLVNDNLRLNKGVQTEGDAYRELKAISSNGTTYDNEAAKDALRRVITKSQEAVTKRGTAILDSHKKAYGDEPFAPFDDMATGWKSNFDNIGQRVAAGMKPAAAAAPAASGGFKIMNVKHP